MEKKLRLIEDILKEKNSPLIDHLQGGISQDYINDSIKNFDLSLPGSVYDLYLWHNGTRINNNEPLDELRIIPLCVFFSIEMNVKTYQYYTAEMDLWSHRFFPLFDSGGGDIYMIDSDSSSNTYGSVFFYSPSLLVVDPEMRFSSLPKMVDIIHALYENGGYDIVPGDGLKVNRKMQREIARNIDPMANYWNQ